jgi:exonuclease SbcC
MQIHRLRLANFRQHEHTELVLGAGLTGIVGPNGAGKTTILEAIAWAMYGMPAARGSRETIRRRGAPPRSRVEVEMEFSLGPHQYRIVRTLNGAELYQDGDPAPIANSIGAVTERITRLLGMTREEFFNTYFTGQKELAVMAAMSAPERAQFLSRVLGYERIRAAQDRLKERRSVLRARLDALRAGLGDLAELEAAEARVQQRVQAAAGAEAAAAAAFGAAEAALADVRPRWEELQRRRDVAVKLEAELRVVEHQAQAARERVERLTRELAEADAAAHQLEQVCRRLAPLEALKTDAAALERDAEAHATRTSLRAQVEDVRRHLSSVDDRLGRLPDAGQLEAVRLRVSDVRATLTGVTLDGEQLRTTWVRDAQDARTKRQGLLDQYQELRDQRQRIVTAGPEGDCPTCARPLGAEYEKVLGVLDRQLEEVVANGNFYKQRIEQLQLEPRELEEAEERRLGLERELSEATSEAGRLEALTQDGPALRGERERLTRRVAELDGALGRLAGAYDQARHQQVLAAIRELEPLALQAERLRVAADRRAPAAAEHASVNPSSVRRAWTRRTELNATLRPDLSDLASGFLRDLTNGRYTDLELDEDYGATLLDDGDPKAVISGGEEDVANLALRLAISQMIAERAGQPLSLLILDEIFGSLDEDRRAAVVDLLRSLADRFPQVILITHIDSVREGFDRVVRVGYDLARGVATVQDEPVGGHDVAA